jgi:hypothetical protein
LSLEGQHGIGGPLSGFFNFFHKGLGGGPAPGSAGIRHGCQGWHALTKFFEFKNIT